jgi:hypothetical protein
LLRRVSFTAGLVFAAAACIGRAASACAQETPLAHYSNSSGSLQATLATRFDLDFFAPQRSPAWLIPETSAFLAPRASAFGEAFAGNSWYALTELRLDRGETPRAGSIEARVEQLFLRYSVSPALELQAGKFVTPFGNYPQRHSDPDEAFIRPPMPYDWPTLVTPDVVPSSNDVFISWKDRPELFRPDGVPPVWGVPYQVGAMVFGTHRSASYRLAVMNSAPSSVPSEWNSIRNVARRPSFVGSLGLQITPDLRTGVSFDYGPYMQEKLAFGSYPEGESADEFTQTLLGAEATYAREHLEIHGEFFYDEWYVPNVIDRPTDYSYYVESKLKLSPGLFIAARAAQIRFNRLQSPRFAERDPLGDPPPSPKLLWDYPCSRLELGAGYHFTSALTIRGQYQWTLQDRPRDLPDNLFSLQLRYDGF